MHSSTALKMSKVINNFPYRKVICSKHVVRAPQKVRAMWPPVSLIPVPIPIPSGFLSQFAICEKLPRQKLESKQTNTSPAASQKAADRSSVESGKLRDVGLLDGWMVGWLDGRMACRSYVDLHMFMSS